MNDRYDQSRELTILKGAVENTNEAFVTIDENHRVLFFNKAAEKIFGYRRDEVIGQDFNIIITDQCNPDHRAAVERYARTRAARLIGHETEFVASRKNGEQFPASISFSVSDVEGKLYFTGIVRDLTESKALQERITRSERLASLGRVVAEITHEIKNPLMTIGGFARQLVRVTSDEDSLKKMNIITEEVSRLENLLTELREFYGLKPLNILKIDLDGFLEEVYSLVRDDCKRNKIEASFKAERKPLIIKGDRDKLKQVFLNLFKNAVEAMEEGGHLSVNSETRGASVLITIADDGSGIPKDLNEKIFSPFFTTKNQGTGLGLSISKSIIEDHEGGSLTFESKEGKGTIFRITLPGDN